MLDAILIVFNRDFAPKDTFVNSILTRMNARGRPYKDWMKPHTPLKVIVHPDAQNPTSFLAQAMVQFRLMGVAFSFDNVEQATFDGSDGTRGTVVSHWS